MAEHHDVVRLLRGAVDAPLDGRVERVAPLAREEVVGPVRPRRIEGFADTSAVGVVTPTNATRTVPLVTTA